MVIRKFENVHQDLYRSYGHACAPAIIDSILEDVIRTQTREAKVPNFLAVFIAREAAERIENHIRAAGGVGTPRQRIHFLSGTNPSQAAFAAAVARKLSAGGVVATAEADHPENAADLKLEWVLDERGLEAPVRRLTTSGERVLAAAEVVVLMGAADTAAAPGRRYVHWEVADDLHASLEEVRALCDGIELKVRDLLAEMSVPVITTTADPMLAA